MKKTSKLFRTIIILCVNILLFTACSPEDGTNGIDGADGQPGSEGAMGNANVVYSDWKYFQGPQRDTIIDGTKLKINHFIEPKLTQDIIDNGSVQVFMRFGATVFPLPYTSDAGSGDKANTLNFIAIPNKLFITRYAHDNSGNTTIGSSVQFRYIFIPGNVAAKGINYSELSYEEICTMFNIPI